MYRFLMVFRAIAGVLTFGRIEMGIVVEQSLSVHQTVFFSLSK